MYKVGVTGGIGSGKSLVCSILKKMGVPVYVADIAARKLMNTDPVLQLGIVKMFGEQAFNKDGLDSGFLATSVFGDVEKLSELNRLVHPVVRRDFCLWASLQGEAPYVVEEAAILFESGADAVLDFTVSVYAPEELRISRVMERDKTDRESVLRRIDHQMSEEEKVKRAGHVINNDGSQMLLPQVIELHSKILNGIE
jgi:dephospho-CoA kinase